MYSSSHLKGNFKCLESCRTVQPVNCMVLKLFFMYTKYHLGVNVSSVDILKACKLQSWAGPFSSLLLMMETANRSKGLWIKIRRWSIENTHWELQTPENEVTGDLEKQAYHNNIQNWTVYTFEFYSELRAFTLQSIDENVKMDLIGAYGSMPEICSMMDMKSLLEMQELLISHQVEYLISIKAWWCSMTHFWSPRDHSTYMFLKMGDDFVF